MTGSRAADAGRTGGHRTLAIHPDTHRIARRSGPHDGGPRIALPRRHVADIGATTAARREEQRRQERYCAANAQPQTMMLMNA